MSPETENLRRVAIVAVDAYGHVQQGEALLGSEFSIAAALAGGDQVAIETDLGRLDVVQGLDGIPTFDEVDEARWPNPRPCRPSSHIPKTADQGSQPRHRLQRRYARRITYLTVELPVETVLNATLELTVPRTFAHGAKGLTTSTPDAATDRSARP